jgi:hypothetical protein
MAWGSETFESFFSDIAYGTRALLRSPALTIVALLSLALGIGANTAIFSLLDAVSLPHSTRYDCVVPVFDNLVSLQVSRESMCLRSDLLDDIPYRVCDGIRSVLMHTMT